MIGNDLLLSETLGCPDIQNSEIKERPTAIDIESYLKNSEEFDIPSEIPADIEGQSIQTIAERPDIPYIEHTSRTALLEKYLSKNCKIENSEDTNDVESSESKKEGLTVEEKAKIKEETGWSDEIIDNIKNMKQYEVLKKAGLVEAEINGRKCLIKENIDLDYKDEDGLTNRQRMERGLAPLDSKTGKPIELHHLGQKTDSPLVELTEEEHRTGEYEDGKKNQSLWHDNTKESEVHENGNNWNQERNAHWKARANHSEGE